MLSGIRKKTIAKKIINNTSKKSFILAIRINADQLVKANKKKNKD